MKPDKLQANVTVVATLVIGILLQHTKTWGLTRPAWVGVADNVAWSVAFALAFGAVLMALLTSALAVRTPERPTDVRTPMALLTGALVCFIAHTMLRACTLFLDLSLPDDRAVSLRMHRVLFLLITIVPTTLVLAFIGHYAWRRRAEAA